MLLILLICSGALYGSQVTTAAKSEFAAPKDTFTSLALKAIVDRDIFGALLTYGSIKNHHRKRRVLEKIATAVKPVDLDEYELKMFAEYVVEYNNEHKPHIELSKIWQNELATHNPQLGKQYGTKK